MRILVCGDRNWKNMESIEKILINYSSNTTIIHGCANGADTLAGLIGQNLKMSVERYPAQWNIYGRAAGPIRNRKMIEEGRPDLVYAFHSDIEKSKGTKNMINQATSEHIPVILITK